MSTAKSYGGWISNQQSATGVASTLVFCVGWMTAASTVFGIGTGGGLSLERLRQNKQQTHYMASSSEFLALDGPRTPCENLSRIREVLNPAVSQLATTFGVSRQSIYNWLNGAPLTDENAAKLENLALAADLFAYEGVKISSTILKRKFANGRTLMQLVQAGESARDAAIMLVQILKRESEQRDRMKARFQNRAKTPASIDFDLPAPNDQT